MTNINKPVPGADQYYPLNEPELGQLLPVDKYPHNAVLPKLFEPLTVRGVTFRNRIFVSPMCQYSSDNGHATDWHFVHVGALATRGPGAITMEATSVTPEGRISPEDAGLWTDTQIPPLQRIVKFAHAHQAVIGVQLSHAGRKASTIAPWVHTDLAKTKNPKSWVAHEDEGGWPDNVFAPSAIAYVDYYPLPKAMTEEDIRYVEDGFVKAIGRVKQVGYDFIELHAAHGYLFHNFLSPLSNKRTDQYGGSLENRMRWPLRVIKLMRDAWDGPFFVRISATDWADFPEKGEDGEWKQWGIEQSKIFAGELKKIGVDLIDVSAAGNWNEQKIPVGPGYQVPFAEAIKKEHPDLLIGSVGLITNAKQAEGILQEGKADAVFLAREFIRDPNFVITAAQELGVSIKPANQYERGWTRMTNPK